MQPGYNSGSEPMWWWKVALHLDEAQLALANAMTHNVDNPGPMQALYERLRDGQAILLEIFRAKGLLPGSTNGVAEGPAPGMPGTPPVVPVPTEVSGEEAAAVPLTVGVMARVHVEDLTSGILLRNAEQSPPIAAEEPAVPEADHVASEAGPEQPEPATSIVPASSPPTSSSDPATEGTGG